MQVIVKKILPIVHNYTPAERNRLQLVNEIRALKVKGCNKSEIGRRLGIDRRTVARYLIGDPAVIVKQVRHRKSDPYESRVTELIQSGYIQNRIVETIISEGYSKSKSSARYLVKHVKDKKHLILHKYCQTEISQSTKEGCITSSNNYIHRSYILKYVWMNASLPLEYREDLFQMYPVLITIVQCIREFKEIYKYKNLCYLYLFIERYEKSNIPEISSFARGLAKDLEAVENSVVSHLSNGFVEGTNSKLKMKKRTMYGRCSRELLKAKMILS